MRKVIWLVHMSLRLLLNDATGWHKLGLVQFRMFHSGVVGLRYNVA
jgi:hypothetical protein